MKDIPFCMELNSRLRQSNEAKIKEVEELYVYKNEINKIVCNILLSFLEKTRILSRPNKFCDIETLVLNLKRALDSFEDNKNVTTVFLRNFGAFFKVETVDNLCRTLSETILKKVIELSDQFDQMKRSIYLVNNFYTLKNYIEDVNNQNINQGIEDNSEIIVNSWKDELSSKTGRRFTDFIDVNLHSFKSYYLPSEIRVNVVPKIKAIIWENILTKEYNGNENELNENINEIFTGK
ncbi:hypothetical protein NBO_80gi002 [Nosema bombycis CQ1]|uniref:Uncharacterized protein n=1 Tax=Nosema bombycis (strain CQ1 / CVCC 102059) TaxID=578461 RepID=R0KSZ4_NOSB1|nr:hypothetical protein NBO_80gi002 [Nosema bombycis CQ1]|eukprot:EOB13347.1 hypothetical protein NBO_80gi002 [Nosema bombycis CQ1]